MAVLKEDDGDSLRFLSLERVKLDSQNRVHDAKWTNETKAVLPPEFNGDWKCQFSAESSAIIVYEKGWPLGTLAWTGQRFALMRVGSARPEAHRPAGKAR